MKPIRGQTMQKILDQERSARGARARRYRRKELLSEIYSQIRCKKTQPRNAVRSYRGAIGRYEGDRFIEKRNFSFLDNDRFPTRPWHMKAGRSQPDWHEPERTSLYEDA